MKKRIAVVALLVLFVSTLAYGDFLWFKSRDPARDVRKITKTKLDDEQVAIVNIVMTFFAVKYGYVKEGSPYQEALKKMSKDEYEHAVAQAAKICTNDVAIGFYRMGKAGEKLLKAIIQTTEDAVKAAGDYIDQKSDQFDKKK